MSRLELRPRTILGALAGLGLVIILGILATGGAAEEEPPIRRVSPPGQQSELDALNSDIAALVDRDFPILTDVQAQENALDLFRLAQDHNIRVRSVVNDAPETVTLGRLDVTTIASNIDMMGARGDVIEMLLNMGTIFGEATLFSNVSVQGSEDEWIIQFKLTQFLRPA